MPGLDLFHRLGPVFHNVDQILSRPQIGLEQHPVVDGVVGDKNVHLPIGSRDHAGGRLRPSFASGHGRPGAEPEPYREVKGGALIRDTLHPDAPTHQFHQAFGDRQA